MRPSSATRSLERRLRRAALGWGVAAVVLLVLGVPAAAPIAQAAQRGAALSLEYAGPAAAPAPEVYWLNLTDAPAFLPANLAGAAPGANVTVHLNNTGSYDHTFTLSKAANYPINQSWTPNQLDRFFATNGSLANLSVSAGRSAMTTFLLPNQAGAAYEFVSLVPYQFQAGMRGFLNVSAGAGARLNEGTSDQLRFLPDTLVVNATSFPVVVDVQITNQGTYTHTWTLSPLAGVFLTPQNFTSYFLAHPPLANAQITTANQVLWANFTIPQKGVYEYICTASGHFAGGMNGTLWVGLLPPPSAAPPSTAIVQGVVLAGVGVLLAIGTLLAVASTFVGRFPSKPPTH
ncbi:MAG: hypothetical protein L3K13_03680 [Thermoplasmata archaeon]|nr:hypothetical protein [Thermoplasmata archaeon]